jgi:hypothetical protein
MDTEKPDAENPEMENPEMGYTEAEEFYLSLADGSEIEELLLELKEVRKARRDLIANGQSVSISGAFSSTRLKLDELKKREREIKLEIIHLRGCGDKLQVRKRERVKHV